MFLDELPSFVKNAVVNVFENFDFFCQFNGFKRELTIKISRNKDLKANFYISEKFIQLLENQQFDFRFWFDDEPVLKENGEPDYIATCFYMINCLQEYANNVEDEKGRFDYKKSYQYHFEVTQQNLVVDYFKEIALEIGIKENLNATSTVFLSHDIDVLNVKKQAIATELKTLDFSALLRTLAKSKFDLLNELINYEQSNSIKATYFWLPVQGNQNGIPHADYSIADVKIFIDQLNTSTNFINGLHKSSTEKSLNEEAEMIANNIKVNRYHFLKYNVKTDYSKLEDAKITTDCSLGFSHTIGFRNSYGLPFRPYSPILDKQFSFWVNPLHIMDSSLIYYTNGTVSEKEKMVKEFIDLNRENCQIGILWHNNYLAGSYKEFFYRIIDTYISGLKTTHGKH
jgi:hypothetical protein